MIVIGDSDRIVKVNGSWLLQHLQSPEVWINKGYYATLPGAIEGAFHRGLYMRKEVPIEDSQKYLRTRIDEFIKKLTSSEEQ